MLYSQSVLKLVFSHEHRDKIVLTHKKQFYRYKHLTKNFIRPENIKLKLHRKCQAIEENNFLWEIRFLYISLPEYISINILTRILSTKPEFV